MSKNSIFKVSVDNVDDTEFNQLEPELGALVNHNGVLKKGTGTSWETIGTGESSSFDMAIISSNAGGSTAFQTQGEWGDISLSRSNDLLTISGYNGISIVSSLHSRTSNGDGGTSPIISSTGPSSTTFKFNLDSSGSTYTSWSGIIILVK